MPMRNVELSEHLDSFIETGIGSGRFGDASEAVAEGLRLLEEREAEDRAKLEWLRSAAKEAFDSLDRGEGIVLNSEQELEEFLRGIHEEVASELAAERKLA